MNNISFVQKLRQEAPEETKYFGIEPQQTARAIMLELRTKEGLREAFPYSYMTRAVYDPTTGITIYVADVTVVVKGRNLENIYHYLLANRLNYLQEDYSGNDVENNDLFVEAIEIKQNGIVPI